LFYLRERLLSEQETKLREKLAAETGWKQDVSNWLLSRSELARIPDGAENLSD
jgi:hypothetical protein